jgi:hypothetical protein
MFLTREDKYYNEINTPIDNIFRLESLHNNLLRLGMEMNSYKDGLLACYEYVPEDIKAKIKMFIAVQTEFREYTTGFYERYMNMSNLFDMTKVAYVIGNPADFYNIMNSFIDRFNETGLDNVTNAFYI